MKSKSNNRSQSGKVTIFTVIITSISTILVAFIAIFPQIREADVNKISYLAEKLESLGYSPELEEKEKLQITGTVVTEDDIPMNAEIYLIPISGYFSVITDDNGRFHFDGVPSQTYSILIRRRDPEAKGQSRKILVLEPDPRGSKIDTTVIVPGASIKYMIRST